MSEMEGGFDWESMSYPDADQSTPEAPPETGLPSEPIIEEPPPQEGRPRDEHGRFLPREPEAPVEEPPATVPEDVPELPTYTPEVQAYLDRYGGDVQKALEAAYAAQQDRGRAMQEMGDMRARLAAIEQGQQQLQYTQEDAQYSQSFDQQLEEDPAQAAKAAFARGDETRFWRAFQSWQEEDPNVAAMWAENQQERFEYEQRIAALEAQIAPIQQQNAESRMSNMFVGLLRRHPDLPDVLPEVNKVLEERKFLHFVAHNAQEPQAREWALEDAYQIAMAKRAVSAPELQREAARAQAQEYEKAQQEAFVASADQAVREENEPSLADLVTEGWDAIPTSHYWGS